MKKGGFETRPYSTPSLRSTGTLAIRTRLQVRSNPVPGGQHTVRIAGLYVNPGLLRRIQICEILQCERFAVRGGPTSQ
ncbi:MAG: hypothetical protein LBM98_02935 [Oscillospiraceae bacterium]|nr:hypothetical protein [Oscillospiraceae bacterium]